MRIVAADDSEIDRELLRRMVVRVLEEEKIDVEYISCENAEKLLSVELEDCDLLFMDIFFGDSNGMELVRRIREKQESLPIAFVTATREYVLESYDVFAYSYLMKPLSFQKLKKLLHRLIKEKGLVESESFYEIRDSRGRVKGRIDRRDIAYVESFNNCLNFHLTNGETVKVYSSLKKVSEELGEDFLQCHQSYIINMKHVKELTDCFVMIDGKEIYIKKRGAKEVRDKYRKYLFLFADD